ncbi:biopolymer transporter ExbD [Sphingomonas sp.]|jgi:biopolymer transport protein ExbD|uniref:ExbD/TolR family protein n=1 Tax=Sphingomonas sp. TaxID=28214 RepID=UPI002E370850|nr:biopolymer transporter ExbD [Sphingomonas sp.]HEX4694947.1 biopolymer transporter ExbD [Sphingomonas sp.]
MVSRVQSEPIATINITPLIDVMLVLLIMMILTIPTMTHKVTIDLPVGEPLQSTAPEKMHRLDIAASGALTFDGAATDEARLTAQLEPLVGDHQALLTVNADAEARYETFDRVLATIKRAGVTRLGFAGNDRFANYGAP